MSSIQSTISQRPRRVTVLGWFLTVYAGLAIVALVASFVMGLMGAIAIASISRDAGLAAEEMNQIFPGSLMILATVLSFATVLPDLYAGLGIRRGQTSGWKYGLGGLVIYPIAGTLSSLFFSFPERDDKFAILGIALSVTIVLVSAYVLCSQKSLRYLRLESVRQLPWRSAFLIGISMAALSHVSQQLMMEEANAARQDASKSLEVSTLKAVKTVENSTDLEERFINLSNAGYYYYDHGQLDKAEASGQELLTVAEKFRDNWNYGNAIYDGNSLLGLVALKRGKKDEAKEFLLRASQTKGSPQLDSFGPDMRLEKELLRVGEKESVQKALTEYRRFWDDSRKINRWQQEIDRGETPSLDRHSVDFGSFGELFE